MLIDADKLFSDTFQLILTSDGYEVTSCDSGSHALELVRERMFHAVVIDYHLPDMTGARVAGLIRTRCPYTEIIGFSLDYRGREFLSAGADRFYQKPFVDEVLSHLHELA